MSTADDFSEFALLNQPAFNILEQDPVSPNTTVHISPPGVTRF